MSSKAITKSVLTSREKFLVFSLFLLTFVLGTSEFVIVGLLKDISSDLNITIAAAGTLISGFAMAFAIGTPILTAFFSRFSKYPLILVLIIVFIGGKCGKCSIRILFNFTSI